MKKLLLFVAVVSMMSCATPTVNQVELYGTVDDIVYLNGHYRVKAWCQTKEKYYNIITDKHYQPGETIRIK
jgi:predicted porin